MKSIRVLCVDDNPLVAEGVKIKLLLPAEDCRFEWAGHLESADELIDKVAELQPDIVLLDIDMPGRDSMSALMELSEKNRQVRVIMLSGYSPEDLLDRAVEAGAWGYVSKNDGPDQVIQAIQRVAKGEFAFGPSVLQRASA